MLLGRLAEPKAVSTAHTILANSMLGALRSMVGLESKGKRGGSLDTLAGPPKLSSRLR